MSKSQDEKELEKLQDAQEKGKTDGDGPDDVAEVKNVE